MLYVLLYGIVIPFAFWVHSWIYFIFTRSKPAEKFFNYYGASKGIDEYNARVRSAITSAFFIALILVFRPLVNATGQPEFVTKIVQSDFVSIVMANALLIAIYMVIIIFIKIYTLRSDNHFSYYLTLGYLESSIAAENGASKNWLFRAALRSYNSYLRRKINLGIRDIAKISLTFRLGDSTSQDKVLEEFLRTLRLKDSPERFGLAPLAFLSKEYGTREKGDILKNETAFSGNSDLRAMLTIFLPLLIALGSLVLEIYKSFFGG